jgi:hypothetical protein
MGERHRMAISILARQMYESSGFLDIYRVFDCGKKIFEKKIEQFGRMTGIMNQGAIKTP